MTKLPNTTAISADFEFDALNEAKNYRTSLLREFGPHLRGNVIEVGDGIGEITAELRVSPSIHKVCSIEPEAGFCAQIHARFPDHDLVHATIADLKRQDGWNTVLSVNVLEHIDADENKLENYFRLLQPAVGALLLFVPVRPQI